MCVYLSKPKKQEELYHAWNSCK